jgi:hypothetical protein
VTIERVVDRVRAAGLELILLDDEDAVDLVRGDLVGRPDLELVDYRAAVGQHEPDRLALRDGA